MKKTDQQCMIFPKKLQKSLVQLHLLKSCTHIYIVLWFPTLSLHLLTNLLQNLEWIPAQDLEVICMTYHFSPITASPLNLGLHNVSRISAKVIFYLDQGIINSLKDIDLRILMLTILLEMPKKHLLFKIQ